MCEISSIFFLKNKKNRKKIIIANQNKFFNTVFYADRFGAN